MRLATAAIGGIISSTILALVVLPDIYKLFADQSARTSKEVANVVAD